MFFLNFLFKQRFQKKNYFLKCCSPMNGYLLLIVDEIFVGGYNNYVIAN